MRWAISGAQSTGKTTLINKLKYVYNIPIIGGVTRSVNKQVSINESGDNTTQILLIQKHIENLIKYQDGLFDRCMLDVYVYTIYLNRHKKVSDSVLKGIEQIFDATINLYDIIFYLKPEFDLVDDGVRSNNLDFRAEVVDIFDTVIQQKNIDVVLLSGDIEQRLAQFIKVVGEYNE